MVSKLVSPLAALFLLNAFLRPDRCFADAPVAKNCLELHLRVFTRLAKFGRSWDRDVAGRIRESSRQRIDSDLRGFAEIGVTNHLIYLGWRGKDFTYHPFSKHSVRWFSKPAGINGTVSFRPVKVTRYGWLTEIVTGRHPKVTGIPTFVSGGRQWRTLSSRPCEIELPPVQDDANHRILEVAVLGVRSIPESLGRLLLRLEP